MTFVTILSQHADCREFKFHPGVECMIRASETQDSFTLRSCLKNYCGGDLRRCAVLEILMYYLYIPVSVLRAPCISPSSRHFFKQRLTDWRRCLLKKVGRDV